jgi:TPR repeat protein
MSAANFHAAGDDCEVSFAPDAALLAFSAAAEDCRAEAIDLAAPSTNVGDTTNWIQVNFAADCDGPLEKLALWDELIASEDFPSTEEPCALGGGDEAVAAPPTSVDSYDWRPEQPAQALAEEIVLQAPLVLAGSASLAPDSVTARADRHAYLQRARRAAQAHSEALQQQRRDLLSTLREDRVASLSVGVGAAALFLLGGAVLVFGGGDDQAHAAATAPVAPAAPTMPAPENDPSADYEASQRLIADGRLDEGLSLLRRAAEGGLAIAQYRLSKHYEAGDGVPQDLTRALAWAERAARGGNVRAMHDVGVYFARGDGAPQDEALALQWFLEAAGLGVADSQFNAALLYEEGRGVAADPRAALFWFLIAARNDEPDAIDRAVAVAATLPPEDVAYVRERARAFRVRAPIAAANEPPRI